MIYTFPHFGAAAVIASKALGDLGIEHITPGVNDRKTLEKGSLIAPCEMCVPFKYMVGNLMDAYEKGADTAVMVSTAGPCRLGEYGQLLIEVLKQSGYDYNWILMDTPSDIGMREFFRRFDMIFNVRESGWTRVVKVLSAGLKFVRAYDTFRRKAAMTAGYLENPYDAVELRRDAERKIILARSLQECMRILKDANRKLISLKRDKRLNPVKILITGEIYTSMEKDLNCGIEETLMKLGCSVRCHIDLTWWIRHTIANALIPEKLTRILGGRDGIKYNIGGYGKQTAEAVIKSGRFDGVIKIMPSGCMPEIVTKAFCEDLKCRRNMKILHLIYDEMSGNAGYETRLEAFVDMLERSKDVLAGNRYRFYKHGHGGNRRKSSPEEITVSKN